jgi:K+/H+ antiporter YhaU regulatory subunit KhtT
MMSRSSKLTTTRKRMLQAGLHFWQQTGATIVAIRRKQSTIFSPGPYAELYGGDIIVFVCAKTTVKVVRAFVNGVNGEAGAEAARV